MLRAWFSIVFLQMGLCWVSSCFFFFNVDIWITFTCWLSVESVGTFMEQIMLGIIGWAKMQHTRTTKGSSGGPHWLFSELAADKAAHRISLPAPTVAVEALGAAVVLSGAASAMGGAPWCQSCTWDQGPWALTARRRQPGEPGQKAQPPF